MLAAAAILSSSSEAQQANTLRRAAGFANLIGMHANNLADLCDDHHV